MAKKTPGLRKRGEIWHIEKTVAGRKLRESTGETELEFAERYLEKRIREIRAVSVYGDKLEHTFDEAAARYIEDFEHKKSLTRDIQCLTQVMPYIGGLELRAIHNDALKQFIKDRRENGIAAGTINRDLVIVKRVLNLAATLWRDEKGRPWLETAPPKFQTVQGPKRKPRPISIEEQNRLLQNLPGLQADMVLFALHTGLRDQEICGMKWSDEAKVSGTDATVFIISEERAKNTYERIIPINSVARAILAKYRGQCEYVFHRNGVRVFQMSQKPWRKAREAAGLNDVRIHDLRHTFGMRLRAAGVSFEDRQDLLGHHAGRITTHYSRVEINRLIECVELLCEIRQKPELTLIRRMG